ncbi:MAG: MCE family protein [Mycobacteriales bacterium]|nr:MCE family protein [Mycobacteriales bacterium]
MSAPIARGAALVRRRVLGLVFLVVIALLVWTTVALYTKRFADEATVLLRADRAGNQLTTGADVKARGLIVGRVSEVSATDDGAELELKLDRSMIGQLSGDVTAQLLPKTLFGEKFVALVPGTSADRLADGDVITQDRSSTALETARVVDDLLPLLRTLKPEQLSTTLGALSSALRDRGDRLGANLELLDAYLRDLNPSLPTLEQDFRGLADFADTLDAAAPDLLSVIEDLSFSSRSVVDQQDELSGFLDATAAFSDETEAFLRENEQRLVRLSQDSLPSLQAYARYAPGFPCLLDGITRTNALAEDTFGGLQPGLHITLEVVQDQNGFQPGDEPQYVDDSGPKCDGLIGEPVRPFQPTYEPRDGYCDEFEAASPGVTTGDCRSGSVTDPPALLLSSEELERAAVAPALGMAADEVPDVATLLFGPLARGTLLRYS